MHEEEREEKRRREKEREREKERLCDEEEDCSVDARRWLLAEMEAKCLNVCRVQGWTAGALGLLLLTEASAEECGEGP